VLAQLAAVALLASSPISLTMGPVRMAAQPGSTQDVVVYDTGRLPLDITMQLGEIQRDARGICRLIGPVRWAAASLDTFSLAPGHNRVVQVKVGDTASPGLHDLAIRAVAAVAHGGGSLQVNAALISQALVTFPGKVASNAPKPCLTVGAPEHSGLSVSIIGGAVGAVLAVAALAAWAVLRLGRRRHPFRLIR
jgi:hypothetical protein